MGYFDDIVSTPLTERTLTVRGRSKTTYWRALTAGQKLDLLKGQVVKVEPATKDDDGETPRRVRPALTEIVLADNAERNQRRVQMTLVDEDGKPVYRSLKELQAEPDFLIEALVALSIEVEADEGNG